MQYRTIASNCHKYVSLRFNLCNDVIVSMKHNSVRYSVCVNHSEIDFITLQFSNTALPYLLGVMHCYAEFFSYHHIPVYHAPFLQVRSTYKATLILLTTSHLLAISQYYNFCRSLVWWKSSPHPAALGSTWWRKHTLLVSFANSETGLTFYPCLAH